MHSIGCLDYQEKKKKKRRAGLGRGRYKDLMPPLLYPLLHYFCKGKMVVKNRPFIILVGLDIQVVFYLGFVAAL